MEESNAAAAPAESETILAGHEEPTGARGDFISSTLLIIFAVAILVESARMPNLESMGFYAWPGYPPIVFATFLLIASGIVFVRSLYRGGYRLGVTGENVRAFVGARSTSRFLYIILCIAVYFALMNYATFFPSRFLFSSMLFLFAMMKYFGAGGVTRCAVYAVLVSLASWLLFEKIFLVPLP